MSNEILPGPPRNDGPPRDEHVHLRPLAPLDPRRNAFRADLAAQALYGKVAAQRYAAGVGKVVARPAVPLRRRPVPSFGFETEALFGERVTVYEEAEGWAWVQLASDGYVGYLPADALAAVAPPATHRVRVPGTFVYPSPDIKVPPLMHLSLNAEVAVVDSDAGFARLASGGFVHARHLIEADRHARDFVEIAEALIATPYLWGGKTRIGLDCSGLVQISLAAAGIPCPRDSDMQQAELGSPIAITESFDDLQRGDLVFWRGHVGIMSDGVMLVHANAYHMAVAVETLPEAAGRIARAGQELMAIKRLPALCA